MKRVVSKVNKLILKECELKGGSFCVAHVWDLSNLQLQAFGVMSLIRLVVQV